jgi:hypothetical protein
MAKNPPPIAFEAQAKLAAEFAAQSLTYALTAQFAVLGALISALARNGTLPLDKSATALVEAAEMIEGPLDRSPSPLQAVVMAPLKRHAQMLRDLAGREGEESPPS